jgi:predicted NBD/HSP70 family sugar kinase
VASDNNVRNEGKYLNINKVYRYIYENGPTSRTEIAGSLGISMPTVLSVVKDLLAQGKVCQGDSFDSTGGRRAQSVFCDMKYRLSVGLDVTKNYIGAVLIDLNGEIIASKRIKQPFDRSEEYAALLGHTVQNILNENAVLPAKVLGVGVSIAGIVGDSGMRIIYSHVLKVSNVPREDLCRYIPFPCKLINDANSSGCAEIRYHKGLGNVLYLSLSNSIGGAIFIDHTLYEGDNFCGGEFGHMTLYPGGTSCYCGKSGCLDPYCSALVLSENFGGNLETFFWKLSNHEHYAEKLWQKYLSDLAIAVNNLRMAFDGSIILGGYVGALMEPYLPMLREKVAERNPFGPAFSFLSCCNYKQDSAAVGAALQFVDDYFAGAESANGA